MIKKKKKYSRLALSLSMCLMIIWGILGTGTSLAWFTDTSPEVKNIFHFAEFDLEVFYKTEDGTYKEITSDTRIFDDEALYEPGYVQVVYLKVKNKGTVDFHYKTAVSVTDYTVAENVFGNQFLLQDYLRFGLVAEDSEDVLMQKLSTRMQAMEVAKETMTAPLNNYYYSTEKAILGAGQETYMALIVGMPEEVGNVANYRRTDMNEDGIPRVELGIIVSASQIVDTE